MRKLDIGPILVAIALAPVIQLVAEIDWWHPHCDVQSGYDFMNWATGFPFPYYQRTTADSGPEELLIPIYLANLVLLAVPTWAILRLLWQRAWVAVQALLAFVAMFGCLFALLATFVLATPMMTTSFSGPDPLQSYRPAVFMNFAKHRRCNWWTELPLTLRLGGASR